ncbi:MAG TPA: pseudouridine synthase [Vitreimonas sp.]|nr:pseudouridine synthase [Vitreimonas sp.]HYD87193.1 pseudouridine synthase [Vitreimonas sp.]
MANSSPPPSNAEPERIAKFLARAGVCSRRDAEKLIAEGRVRLNGRVLDTPAVKISAADKITVDGRPIGAAEPTRLWRYHKPSGLVTTHRDPAGRPTVFQHLPQNMPRVISVGRLDLTSEGLLLLTNDGELARRLELPANGWLRRYRARAFGRIEQAELDQLKNGITVDGVRYGAIEAKLERGGASNAWITMSLTEGKNREVRRVLDALGLKVNRLIRVSYGPFQLGTLEPGAVEEVPRKVLKEQLGKDALD